MPSTRNSLRWTALTFKLAINGKGNAAHAEETYMRFLVTMVARVTSDPELEQALESVQQVLNDYRDLH